MLTLLVFSSACNTGTFLDVPLLLPPKATVVSKSFTSELWNGDCIDSRLPKPPEGKGYAWGFAKGLGLMATELKEDFQSLSWPTTDNWVLASLIGCLMVCTQQLV